MQTRVFLLRHAETATPSIFHGAESDVGLSERGKRQVLAMADYFAAVRPEAIVSSGMRRAIDTARPIADSCCLTLQIEPSLHERRVGILSGQPHTPEHPLWGESIRRWMAGETGFTTEGAESFDEMRTRLVPAWERVMRQHAGKSLVVVAHGIVCKVLMLSILTGWHVGRWKELGPVPNLAVSELIGEAGSWRAESLNLVPVAVIST